MCPLYVTNFSPSIEVLCPLYVSFLSPSNGIWGPLEVTFTTFRLGFGGHYRRPIAAVFDILVISIITQNKVVVFCIRIFNNTFRAFCGCSGYSRYSRGPRGHLWQLYHSPQKTFVLQDASCIFYGYLFFLRRA